MTVTILTVSLAWLGLLTPVQEAGEEPVAMLAFVGATVLPLDSELRLADHTLLVVDGRIAALGPRAEVELPAGARVIEATGRFLMPGLVDMHVHTWGEGELDLFLANGVTTVRNLFGSPMHLEWRQEVESGARLGPTIVTAGPIVDGNPPHWPGSIVVTTPEEARDAVRAHFEAGYDFIKVYDGLSAEAYAALMEEAALAGLAVDGHVPAAVGIEGVLASEQRVIEHFWGYGAAIDAVRTRSPARVLDENLAWQRIDESRLSAMVERTLATGTWNCPTLVVFQKWLEPAEFERALGFEPMRYVPPFVRELWREMNAENPPELRAAGRESLPGRMRLVKALSEAGGRLVLGTDMGNPLVLAGFAVHEELANFVAAGLTPYQALVAATRSPAECLGLEGEFGTLAVGLRADLLLLDADPLLDVGHAREPAGVMVRGRWLERAELARRLEQLAAPSSEQGR